MTNNQNLKNLGSWQQEIFNSLTKYGEISSPISNLRGKAKNYYGNYSRSFNSLLEKMKNAGYIVARIPGIRGGEYTAKYILLKSPKIEL